MERGPEDTQTLTGVIDEQVVAGGSKSERRATVLRVDGADPHARPLVLRRPDTPTLGADPWFAPWLGQRVRVRGRQAFASFVVTAIEPITAGGQ